jgi:hypothetical protein
VPTSKKTLIQARLASEETRYLDEYRRERPDIPTRAVALRDLALAALRTRSAKAADSSTT